MIPTLLREAADRLTVTPNYCVYLRRADGKGTVEVYNTPSLPAAKVRARSAFRWDRTITMIWVLQEPGNCSHLILTVDDRKLSLTPADIGIDEGE